MAAVEFINFMAMLIMGLIVIRAAQVFGRNTWLAPALGAIHA
ncbi:MAG TPA: hypothetical protein VFP55_13630 [Solirubrobacteraceae bacterium]|nr:hypothetical protein [Solirubrobacteraceae bacterium]